MDDVEVYPVGTASTGYCGTIEGCTDGRSCTYPYRTVGYCLTPPAAPTTQTTFFNLSNWGPSNSLDVYMNTDPTFPHPLSPNPIIQPRCSKHLCPIDGSVTSVAKCGSLPFAGNQWTNTSTCTEQNCGPYNFDIKCNLFCNGGYFSAQTDADHPTGTCCYENCPAGPPFNGEGGCNYVFPANVSSWTNESTCISNKCATVVVHGYTVTEKCKANCSAGYFFSGASQYYPIDGCCKKTCPAFPYGTSCPANPSDGFYTNNSTCIAIFRRDTISNPPICTLGCDDGYHVSGGNCVADPPACDSGWNSAACEYNGGGYCTHYGGPTMCGWSVAKWCACYLRCVGGIC